MNSSKVRGITFEYLEQLGTDRSSIPSNRDGRSPPPAFNPCHSSQSTPQTLFPIPSPETKIIMSSPMTTRAAVFGGEETLHTSRIHLTGAAYSRQLLINLQIEQTRGIEEILCTIIYLVYVVEKGRLDIQGRKGKV